MYYDVTRAMCYDWSWVFAIIIVGWIIGDLSIDHLQTIYDDNLQLFYVDIRVSEPACFGPLRLWEVSTRSRLQLLVKENIMLDFF